MAIQFKDNYDLLELDSSANWEVANANYRRLVHIWHPDRFAQRPRERVHAQKQFIELTKAFNNLRTYYRQNQRLPFQQIKQSVADSPVPPAHQRVAPADASVLESSILNKRKPSKSKIDPGLFKAVLWSIPVATTLMIGLVIFVVVDRTAKMRAIEEAKRVLRAETPSQYMVNKEELSLANSRAALMHKTGTGAPIGDQLVKDVFK